MGTVNSKIINKLKLKNYEHSFLKNNIIFLECYCVLYIFSAGRKKRKSVTVKFNFFPSFKNTFYKYFV